LAPPAAGLVPPAAAVAAGQVALSRYRSDFQELNPLGRGGFGVVVAAINRYAWLTASSELLNMDRHELELLVSVAVPCQQAACVNRHGAASTGCMHMLTAVDWG
jgi:hypothetical protein